MSEPNTSDSPVTEPSVASFEENKSSVVGSPEGSPDEVKPLSAIEAYRQDRARVFAERVKKIKEQEAYKEANMRALQETSQPAASSVTVAYANGDQAPAVAESAENEIFNRPAEVNSFPLEPERKFQKTMLSLAIFIGLPVLIAFIYYGFIASDQYAATAQFSIHSNAPPSSGSSSASSALSSMIGGSSQLATIGQMFTVQEYVSSSQMLRDISAKLDVRKIYGRPEADYWSRLPGRATDDKLLKYWNQMVEIEVDNTTGLGIITVRAFTPQDAKAIADNVLALSESLVNKGTIRSQQDTVDLAQKEVDSTSSRVLKAHQALREFAAKLAGPDGSGVSASEALSIRDQLNLELNFAEQAYAGALNTLETARLVATTRGFYLEPFVQPQLADFPTYPQRYLDILLVFLLCSLLWVLGVLVVAATKEHL